MSKIWIWIISILGIGAIIAGVVFYIKWKKEQEAKDVANATTAKVLTSPVPVSPTGSSPLTPLATNTTATVVESGETLARYKVA